MTKNNTVEKTTVETKKKSETSIPEWSRKVTEFKDDQIHM